MSDREEATVEQRLKVIALYWELLHAIKALLRDEVVGAVADGISRRLIARSGGPSERTVRRLIDRAGRPRRTSTQKTAPTGHRTCRSGP